MKSIHKSRNRFIILSLVVPVILLLIFVVYPSVDLVAMSFTSWDGVSPERPFNGIRNYIEMFTKSPDLWLSLRNNFIYLAVHMVMIPIELGIAVMLNSGFKGAKLVKTIAFLPFIINGVGMSYAFSYFFSPVNGAFNQILTGLGLSGWICKWLSDPAIVNFVLAAVSAWRFSGYHIVLFSTGLTSIPTEMMEAARIDGANAWHQLWRIQLPNIWLVFSFVMFDCIRGTPLLIQIFIIYFALPNIIGHRIDPFIAAVTACSLNSGAYIAEIFRGGIQSISQGQFRAGLSLGMTYGQTMRYIVLPQAFKRIIPPLGNEFIAMLKDSSLVSVIGFEELTRSGQLIIAETYGTLEIWTCVAIIYLTLTLTISRFVAALEKRFRKSDDR